MPPLQRFEPSKASALIELPAKLENLPRLIGPVLAVARSLPLSEDKCCDLELALEESLVNICTYAYPEKGGRVRITYRVENDCLVVGIEDEGVIFSVLESSVPDLSVDLSARKIGGLGIHLVRSLVDDVRYRREAKRNYLELVIFFRNLQVYR
jgi:serine/threonine-protein kinase RsbW